MTTQEAVSTTVRAELELLGMSKSELARRIGMEPGSLGNKLTGRRRWHVDELDRLAAALGVTVQRLVATVRYRLERATVTTRYQSLPGVSRVGGLAIWTGR